MITISSLERSARRLAKDLEDSDLKVEVEVFKTGHGGDQHYGPSFVELCVRAPSFNSACVRFVANGYAASGAGRFGGEDSWSTMKRKALASIKEQLGEDWPERAMMRWDQMLASEPARAVAVDLSELDTTTTNGKTFTGAQHAALAVLIFQRWGCDVEAACVAWRRLFQNSTTVRAFQALVDAGLAAQEA